MPTFTISSKKPVVVMDVGDYEEIQDRLERLEFLESRTLKSDETEAMTALQKGITTSLEDYDKKRHARRTIAKS